MNRIIRFLSSLKIAITVIFLIVVLAIPATLIPQGMDSSFYLSKYGNRLGNLILSVQFDSFWRSALFLVLMAVFFVNLFVCTLRRVTGRIRRKAPFRIGPDLIHVSLLLLIIAGVFSLFTRQETVIFLAEGNSFGLPDGTIIRLEKFDTIVYDDGRPKDWISKVEVLENGIVKREFNIEVNKPLHIGEYRIFQISFQKDVIAVLEKGGKKIMIKPGEAMPHEGGIIGFVESRVISGKDTAIFLQEKNGKRTRISLTPGRRFADFFLEKLIVRQESGLQVVTQKGVFLVYIALAFLCIGLSVSFYQKMGDTK